MANTYTLIASNTLNSDTSSVTFSSIPQTYSDLSVRFSIRFSQSSNTFYSGTVDVNGTSTYNKTTLSGDGTTPTSTYTTGSVQIMPAGLATSNTFNNGEIYIPNYASTSQNKHVSWSIAAENNATLGWVRAVAMLVNSTSAITSITFGPDAPDNLVSGSSFYLYGIKNS
jgi:hypothetical protein